MEPLIHAWAALAVAWHRRVGDSGPEAGQVVNEWLGLSALGIVTIVAIGAALRALGLDIIEWIRVQLGL